MTAHPTKIPGIEPAAATRDTDEEAAGQGRSCEKGPRPQQHNESSFGSAMRPIGSKLSAVGTKPMVFYGAAIVLLGAAIIAMGAFV
jgi:hypothetical protein